MPCWYYDKSEFHNTPSIADGINFEMECRYRKEGARFIVEIGGKLELGCNTMATGVVYFHRFYMFHSFREFPRFVMASCCLFLAGKVEETPKKCKDIIRIAKESLSEAKFATFGDNPKEEVMILEKILLQTIKFDFQIEHPYGFIVKYAKCLKGDKNKLQKMVQMAWTFVNDSLCTTLCLQWEPEIIAIALMYLAGKLSQFEVVSWTGRTSNHLRWWDLFVQDITIDLLEDICHQVLDLYSQPTTDKVPDSPPVSLSPCPTQSPQSAIPSINNTNAVQTQEHANLIPENVSTVQSSKDNFVAPEKPKPTVNNVKSTLEKLPPVATPAATAITNSTVMSVPPPYIYPAFSAPQLNTYPHPPPSLQPSHLSLPPPLPPGPLGPPPLPPGPLGPPGPPNYAIPPPNPSTVYPSYIAPTPPPPHYPPGVAPPPIYYANTTPMTQQPSHFPHPPPPHPYYHHQAYYPS